MRRSPSSSWARAARHKRVAAVVAAVVLLAGAAGVAVGTATAGSGGPAYALTASVAARTAAAGQRGSGARPQAARRHFPGALARLFALGRRAIELQAVVPDKGAYVTVTLVRGVVSAVSATDVSITARNGVVMSDTVTAATRVLPAAVGGIAGVHRGDHVAVVARDGQATLIWLPGARAHTVRGVVRAVSADSLVITTADGRVRHLVVTSRTHVVPTSAGGLAGLQDGARIVVRERAGDAVVIRVVTTRSGPAKSPGSAARTAQAEHTA